MKRIVEIIPARPGWYARWRLSEATRCYPVALWALLEESGDEADREVIGMDTAGRWPGSADIEPEVRFVRYLFQPPEQGRPEDADPTEQGVPHHLAALASTSAPPEEFEPDLGAASEELG